MHTVYIHKNKANDKVYIGMTGQKPEKRWRKGQNYAGNIHFTNSIKKHGWDGFEHIIFKDNLTKEQAEEIEINLIKEYESTDQDKGYNIQNGGNSIGQHSEETKKLISEIQCKPVYQYDRYTGLFIANFNSTIEADAVLNVPNAHISAVCLKKMKTAGDFVFRYISDGIYEYGEPLPKEELEWVNKNDCEVVVVRYDLEGNYIDKYESIVEAGQDTGALYSSISGCLSGKNKTAGGYIWKRKSEVGDNKSRLSLDEIDSCKNGKHKAVYQYSLDGEYIAEYPTLSEASRQTGTQVMGISKTCRLMERHANKFLWKYSNDVVDNRNLTQEEVDEYRKINYKKPLSENKQIRSVVQYSLDGEYISAYDTIAAAAKTLDVSSSHITSVCKMNRKMAYDYIWKYAKDSDGENNLTEEELAMRDEFFRNKDKRYKKIDQCTLDGKYIKTFDSLAEAAQSCTDGNPAVLARCCKSETKNYRGFIWKYA